jgi:divinyl protochlorophyllide a 8-vinyl-reductase
LAARLFVMAIAKHAWTFTGSGAFSYRFGPELTLRIVGSPVCRLLKTDNPACHYFAGTFARLFTVILHTKATVTETECAAAGAPACRFRVTW